MVNFSIKKLVIITLTLLLLKNLAMGETILPKAQPKYENNNVQEKILPKVRPKIEKDLKIKVTTQNGNLEEKKFIIPKNKPLFEKEILDLAKKKKYLLPKVKPFKKKTTTKEKDDLLEKKITKKQLDPNLIFPKKKPIIYQKPSKKITLKSKHFSKDDLKLAKKIFSEIDKKKWTRALK